MAKGVSSSNSCNIIFKTLIISWKVAKLPFTMCAVGGIVNLVANTKCEKTYFLRLSSQGVYVRVAINIGQFFIQITDDDNITKHSKFYPNV